MAASSSMKHLIPVFSVGSLRKGVTANMAFGSSQRYRVKKKKDAADTICSKENSRKL